MDDVLSAQVGSLLRRGGLYLAVAESCTGGLLGHRLTNVPGSSDYFLGGVIAYADSTKQALLGVKAETLLRFGAVSRETVLEMARGVRERLRPSGIAMTQLIGLAISGIAGPGGGTPDKPVGLTWIALSTADGEWAWSYRWEGDRLHNKASSAEQALRLLLNYLEEHVSAC
ncbi:CinA family protein [uncultured Thermanaerothrix sp.]|uniref:CinA family protein n=1 Tax=uncultured Thermanaerothrix sp. TaxID=1195149 RepID=UPI0026291F01|nr:CinA family protein [uncultured Thermanaerothrix sp.]